MAAEGPGARCENTANAVNNTPNESTLVLNQPKVPRRRIMNMAPKSVKKRKSD
jgi:hypothetical protein